MPALRGHQMNSNHIVGGGDRCLGCGLHHAVHGEHRPDCTAHPSPLLCDDCGEIRLPSERKPIWRYQPKTRTYHCPNHPKGNPA